MFLCAQLSYGLSTEYSKQPQASNQGKVDADRDKYAKFYVHQILSMGEEGIRDAYRRVSYPGNCLPSALALFCPKALTSNLHMNLCMSRPGGSLPGPDQITPAAPCSRLGLAPMQESNQMDCRAACRDHELNEVPIGRLQSGRGGARSN